MKREHIGYGLLLLFGILALLGMLSLAPIEQNQAYHNFIDNRTFFGISNFWNVTSNMLFMIIGLMGLLRLRTFSESKSQYSFFFLGVFLVSIGSGYYHLNPNDTTLIWDRLPMTIAFMALFSIIISECIDDKKGRLLLLPLLLIGFLSVFYWVQADDLRPYLLVQFYPMLAIPVILIFFQSRYNSVAGYWILLLAYLVAKILEYFDEQIYDSLGLSGHSLKHIVAAFGIYILLYTYKNRIKTRVK